MSGAAILADALQNLPAGAEFADHSCRSLAANA
jgi:hypothetical protein